MRSDEGGCGLGKQAAEVGGREQQVGVGAPAAQAVAQDVGENLGRGGLRWSVERGDAERFPKAFA